MFGANSFYPAFQVKPVFLDCRIFLLYRGGSFTARSHRPHTSVQTQTPKGKCQIQMVSSGGGSNLLPQQHRIQSHLFISLKTSSRTYFILFVELQSVVGSIKCLLNIFIRIFHLGYRYDHIVIDRQLYLWSKALYANALAFILASPEGLVEMQILEPNPPDLDSVALGCDLRISISHWFPYDMVTATSQTHFKQRCI